MTVKKLISVLLIAALIFNLTICVSAAEGDISVRWSADYLAEGQLSAYIFGAPDGKTVVLALYDGDMLTNVARGSVLWGFSFVEIEVGEVTKDSCAKLFLLDMESLAPEGEILSVLKPQATSGDGDAGGGEKELWVSDNQVSNKSSSVAYHSIEPLVGKYKIGFNLTVNEKGDNAVLLGDSSNGSLIYEKSSAVLLFNSDYFSSRSGGGSGSYTEGAKNICEVRTGETYSVLFEGDVTKNTYTITIINSAGRSYKSGVVSARLDAASIDTIALVSNSHNTTVGENGEYSNYKFYITGFSADGERESAVYSGFAGRYFAVKVNGRYIRGNNGKITADYDRVYDDSAKFLPRDMADGTFSFMCLSSKRRITAKASGQRLESADYDYNGDSQHWLLEEGPNYTEENPAYYLKSLENGTYIGLDGNYLSAKSTSGKAEFVFEPLNSESPLYLISERESYASLSAKERRRMEEVYESMAGDVFDRYSNDIAGAEWTLRLRMDNMFKEILNGNMTKEEEAARFRRFLGKDDGHLMTDGALAGIPLNENLPDTDGVSLTTSGGESGTYDFWNGAKLSGTKYTLTIYNKAGEPEQTITLYVHNDSAARANAETLKSVITKIPYIYRKNIRNMKVRNDTANSYNCGASDLYVRLNYTAGRANMLNAVAHELSHSIDQSNGSWSQGDGWNNAMKNDMFMASQYANTTKWEDFAEFGRLYFASYGNRDRQRAIQVIFPNRYASYYRLRNNNLGGFELWDDVEYLD